MAKVFLSYDRDDLGKAKSVAAFLEDAGHSVWWDRNIRGGAQYTKEIERALEDCDAVVVLWSEASINSEWVRDEATEGRDRGTLVPVLLDPVKPPMGFRQFQTVDLTDWTEDSPSARADMLLSAIGDEIAGPVTTITPANRGNRKPALSWNRRPIAAVAAMLIFVVAAAWWQFGGPSAARTVSVTATDDSDVSKTLANNLLVKLGVLRDNEIDAITIVEARPTDADLNFKISGSADQNRVRASIALISSAKGAMLWSHDYDHPGSDLSDLEAQIAYSAARVLRCAGEEGSGTHGRLSERARRTYLNACADLADLGWDKRPVVSSLRQVLEEAPKFRPAWAKLVFAEADVLSFLITENEPVEDLRKQLRNDIAAARKIDPHMAEATLAEIELGNRDSVARHMALADKAKLQDPDNALVLSTRAMALQKVGRMAEAVSDSRRAAELDPLSPTVRNALIMALAYAGELTLAREELSKAKRLFPGARAILDAQGSIERRFGDFEKALREDGNLPPGAKLYIQARKNTTDANVAQFLAHFSSHPNRDATTVFVLQALGEMNRVDDFFAFAEQVGAHEHLGFDSYALFRPWVAPARRDPRFMLLAKKLGLVDYWRSSGKWPDFCREPDHAYDCKAEAAKLG